MFPLSIFISVLLNGLVKSAKVTQKIFSSGFTKTTKGQRKDQSKTGKG